MVNLASSRGILLTQALRFSVRLITAASLARMLQPREFGLFWMAAVVHGIAYVLQDAGLATLTLRKPELSAADRNALFWLNAGAGLILTVVVALFSPVIAAWYGEWTVAALLSAMSVTFFINGLHAQLRAQMARERRFAELNRIEIAAFMTSSVAAVTAAALGAGYWALVALPVAAEVVLAIGIWRAQRWRPGKYPRPMPYSLLATSAPFSGFEVIRYLMRNADQLLVGRWLGAYTLGFYSRASQLVGLPTQYAADPLAQWAIVRLAPRGEGAGGRGEGLEFWPRLLNGLMHFFLPIALLFYFLPAEVIRIFFGPQWAEAVPVLQGLSLSLAAQPLLIASSWLLISRGRTLQLLVMSSATCWGLILAVMMVKSSASFIAYATGSVLLAASIAGAGWTAVATGLGLGAVVRGTTRPVLLAVLAGFVLHLVLDLGIPGREVGRVVTGSVAIAACWLGAAFFWGGLRQELADHVLLRTK